MKTGRWARILCGVGCGLAFALALVLFAGVHAEAAYEPPLRNEVLPIFFFVAAIIAFMATVWMKTSPRVGGVVALTAALVCFPSAFVQDLGPADGFAVMWLIAGAPLLIASALAFRAARRMGSG